jgi:hypothetical protein
MNFGLCSSRARCAGFSLVELIIAAGIFALISSAMVSFMRQQGQSMLAMRYVATRDSLKNRLRVTGSSEKALNVSSTQPENIAMKRCLDGAGCKASIFEPFALYDAFGVKVAGAGAEKPVRYTIDGAGCSVRSPQCPIEVYSEIRNSCLDAACLKPSDFEVKFTIRQAAGVKIPGTAILKTDGDIAPQVRAQKVLPSSLSISGPSAPSLAEQGVNSCTRGQVMRGILPNGKADCVSLIDAWGLVFRTGYAFEGKNPNAAGGPKCGWDMSNGAKVTMKHVVGRVCCKAGEVAIGGGGVCNYTAGGYLESSMSVPGDSGQSCWFVDCCKYSPYSKSPIWVQCVSAPNVDVNKILPRF